MKIRLTVAALFVVMGHVFNADASGIFTLRGKLKGFTESEYMIETKSLIYELRKSSLSHDQIKELSLKKTGQPVEMVVTTESVARVQDVKTATE